MQMQRVSYCVECFDAPFGCHGARTQKADRSTFCLKGLGTKNWTARASARPPSTSRPLPARTRLEGVRVDREFLERSPEGALSRITLPLCTTMKLVVLDGRFAVCRLPPTAPPPAWVAQSQPFYSITRTADELSIVCREEVVAVPASSLSDGKEGPGDPVTMELESGWKALKVQGPLAFSMTGVLSSLASPLAAASVSIFAVSTYDTDYLLIKADALEEAIFVLRGSGHEVLDYPAAPSERTQPRDGPAVSFEPDPLVLRLLLSSEGQHPLFSLCLVAGWPPRLTNSESFQLAYERFCAAVEQCWDDLDRSADKQNPASVYFYPYEHLHVTVATFHRPGLENVPLETQVTLRKLWSQVVEHATQDQLWPTEPFSLQIDSAQIGTRAGILLWNDDTGGLSTMRQCLRRAVSAIKTAAESQEVVQFLESLDVPSIVHSTFLRFREAPHTDGALVQQRFSETVLPSIGNFFPEQFKIPVATLVCERTPYMHIPFDDHHVFASTFFTTKVADRWATKTETALERLES
jgi:uncharacterized protein